VVGLYRDLLGRTPAESEINGWLRALAQGATGAAVAYGFAASPERISLRNEFSAFVNRPTSVPPVLRNLAWSFPFMNPSFHAHAMCRSVAAARLHCVFYPEIAGN
jgi:hypothetical protein